MVIREGVSPRKKPAKPSRATMLRDAKSRDGLGCTSVRETMQRVGRSGTHDGERRRATEHHVRPQHIKREGDDGGRCASEGAANKVRGER